MILSPLPIQKFFGNDGRPLVGGLLFTYEAGTTTKVATYTDASGGSLNTNPIVLDYRGECNLWLDGNVTYKFVLSPADDTDPPTNPIWTVDDIQAVGLTPQQIGQILWPRNAAEISAGITPSDYGYEWYDPRRYATIAQWSAVMAAVGSLADSYPGWYRGDRAQHPALTNCIVGYNAYDDAQKTGTTGYRCTAIGALALRANTSTVTAGGTNTAIGYASMENCVECSGNTACGALSLNSITGVLSSHNNAFGYRVLPSLVDGTQNNGFGFQVLDLLEAGNNNHGFGENALSHVVVGQGNHGFGYQSLFSKPGGSFTHAYGYQSLFNETAATITAISKAASAVITINTVSTINPFSAGQPVVIEDVGGMTEINGLTGIVSAIGGSSGAWTITVAINSSGFTTYTSGGTLSPHGNTVFGYRVGFNVSMRGGCTIVGADAGQAAEPGYGNTFCGYQAGNTVNCNTGSGDGGELNTLIGFWSGRLITSGASNSCYGQRSGENLTTGTENVCAGPNSGNGITTADRNVAIGSQTAVNLNGDSNTSVGYNAGTQASAQTYTNCGSFGANATPNASNQITLGDSSIATLRCQQTSITALSDIRFKHKIRPLKIPNDAMEDLQVVIFEWMLEGMPKGPQIGFIAQALDEWQAKWGLEHFHLVDKSDPDRWEATPGKLLFPLIVAYQKLAARVSRLEGNGPLAGNVFG